MKVKHFVPLPRLQYTRIKLNPSIQKRVDLYPPANYFYDAVGVLFTCPHCGSAASEGSIDGQKRVNVGVYEVYATFRSCLGCGEPYFTVSEFDIKKYWSK